MNSMQIRCFIEVAKCLNFTKAAEKLYLTQPAISRNISLLEQEWEIKLFVREDKRKETTLTAAGQIMAKGLIGLQAQFEELLLEARQMDQGKAGTLKVGLVDGERIDDRLLNALRAFQEENPGVDTFLRRGSYSENINWLEHGKIDCCMIPEFEVLGREWMGWRPLFDLDSVLILSKTHPLAKYDACRLADCAPWAFITLEHQESYVTSNLLMAECAKAGFTPKAVLVPTIKEQLLFLEAGKGIMIGSKNNMYVGQNHMVTLLLEDLMPITQVLAWKKAEPNPCVQIFYGLITETYFTNNPQ